ncbi:hypothetical protein P7C70_g8880, partial [Phenoliferia sp. Uapishka_3]
VALAPQAESCRASSSISTSTYNYLSSPIAPRTYLLPSSTSRKRKTSAVELELAKRQCFPTETGEQNVDIPEDLQAAIEWKRLLNTVSARKSRMRKQKRLQELEDENAQLKAQNEQLLKGLEVLAALVRARDVA